MKAINEWIRIYEEEGEKQMWCAIGASALLTALVVVCLMKVIEAIK